MKGFTLLEVALVILITTILASIAFRFTVFTGDTLYLRNFIYEFASNLNLIRDFALGKKSVSENQVVCGYGILISNNEYFGYVYATSSFLDCDLIASTTPQAYGLSTPIIYLHTNGEARQNPIEPLQIKDKFLKRQGTSDYFRISLTSPTCSDDLFSSYQKIALVYYNPYGDFLLLGDSGSGWLSLLPPNNRNIYFCFKFKNEERYLKINQSGQAVFYTL